MEISAKPTNRDQKISDFLHNNDLDDYQITKVAGDASFRNYYRISKNNEQSLILMDAPPQFEDIKPFIKIDEILIKNHFSAPKIYAIDHENGFLLLEDFGDDSYTKILIKSKDKEGELYKLATNLLIDLHKIEDFEAPEYDEELLMREVMFFVDWYLPHIAKSPATDLQIAKFKDFWKRSFAKLSAPSKLVLRDYHADNLMLISGRDGCSNIGLLDFQDATRGSAAYDLVSLLEDARRDVNPQTQEKMLQYYVANSNCDKEAFLYDYKLLSLQRNIKIIGIFARLAARDQKKNYLKLLPRVFNYVRLRSCDPEFQEIEEFLKTFIDKYE